MKKIWIILIIGILIRLFLATTTFHPDIRALDLGGRLIASGNILNLYDYQANLQIDDPMKKLTEFIYPPAIYLVHGLFQFLYSGILKIPFPEQFLLEDPQNFGNILFNIHLLLLKTTYLFFDLLVGFLLMKLVSEKWKKIIFAFWMFNPLNLYSTYMMGQFDIIPTFFILLSFYLVSKNKLEWAALSLGGGIAFKIFPIFLVVPFIIMEKNLKNKIKFVILVILPYVLSILPYLPSQGFRSTALLVSQSDKSLYARIPLSGGEAIILFPTLLLLFYFIVWKRINKFNLWRVYLICLFLFFIFTHFHPQWLIWITPFLIIAIMSQGYKNILPVILILTSWIGSLFFFDPSLTLGLFAPIFPLLNNAQSIWVYLNLQPDYNLSRSIIQSTFVAASMYLIYQYFPRKNNE